MFFSRFFTSFENDDEKNTTAKDLGVKRRTQKIITLQNDNRGDAIESRLSSLQNDTRGTIESRGDFLLNNERGGVQILIYRGV